MKFQAITYIATAVVFLGIDSIWLSTMGNLLYRPVLGEILQEKFSPLPAVAFYLIYILGSLVFAITPAMSTGKWMTALTYGAMFGFFAYATYDLTNQATLKRWSTLLSVVDIGWGTVLTGLSAAAGFVIASTVVRWIGE